MGGIHFIFLKERPRSNSKVLQYQVWTSVKRSKSSYHVSQILTLFRKLVTLILGWNCVKDLRVTKIVREIQFEETWGVLEAKNCFQRQALTKYLRKSLVFMWNSALWEKFNFYFQRVFLLVLTKFSFWEEDWALGHTFMKFWHHSELS